MGSPFGLRGGDTLFTGLNSVAASFLEIERFAG